MAAADYIDVSISRTQYDPVGEEMLYTLTGQPVYRPPSGVPASNWYPRPPVYQVLATVKKTLLSQPAGGMSIAVDADNNVIYTKWDLINGSYANPVRVNHDGTPYTG